MDLYTYPQDVQFLPQFVQEILRMLAAELKVVRYKSMWILPWKGDFITTFIDSHHLGKLL